VINSTPSSRHYHSSFSTHLNLLLIVDFTPIHMPISILFPRTHTEIRTMAIRREMERLILNRKLKETADDWATPVEDLSPIVKKHAQRWAQAEVSESVLQQVLTSWEMERHHSAERHLFPGVVDALKKIKQEHPDVIIGAVTDGRANPKLMTFTLAPSFDFCMN
jgi:hypothetical protein